MTNSTPSCRGSLVLFHCKTRGCCSRGSKTTREKWRPKITRDKKRPWHVRKCISTRTWAKMDTDNIIICLIIISTIIINIIRLIIIGSILIIVYYNTMLELVNCRLLIARSPGNRPLKNTYLHACLVLSCFAWQTTSTSTRNCKLVV